MEIKTTMATCPNGHHYDTAKHASCPYCAGANSTVMPDAGAAGSEGGFSPTEAPGSSVSYGGQQNAAFGATIAPDAARSNPEPFGVATTIGGEQRADGDVTEPVVGWLVCISGPARGMDYRLHAGYNYIGRESGDIRIRGDLQISRQNHAMIAYDSEGHLYFVGPSAGRNIIRVNNRAVLTAVEIQMYDVISIGTTKLMFVPLCGDNFSWEEQG